MPEKPTLFELLVLTEVVSKVQFGTALHVDQLVLKKGNSHNGNAFGPQTVDFVTHSQFTFLEQNTELSSLH